MTARDGADHRGAVSKSKRHEIRRRLAHVTREDRDTAGRPILYGYGLRHLAGLGDVGIETARRGARLMPLELPAQAVAWALAARGEAELADRVLEALGYAPRWREKRRNQIPVK